MTAAGGGRFPPAGSALLLLRAAGPAPGLNAAPERRMKRNSAVRLADSKAIVKEAGFLIGGRRDLRNAGIFSCGFQGGVVTVGMALRMVTPPGGKTPIRGVPSPSGKNGPSGNNRALIWIVCVLAALAVIGGIAVCRHNDAQRRAQEKRREQALSAEKRNAELQKRAAVLKAEREREAGRRAAAAVRDSAAAVPPSDGDAAVRPAPEDSAPPDDSPEAPADAVPEPEEAAAEEPPPRLSLSEAGAADPDNLRLYAGMLREACRDKTFPDLRLKLKTALSEAWPSLFRDEGALPRYPSENEFVRSAFAVYVSLSLAQSDAEEVEREDGEAFQAWLLADKCRAANAFVKWLVKYKIDRLADAADMMSDLRAAWKVSSKKAYNEIRSIANPLASNVSKKLYPCGKKEIAAKIAEINKTRAPGKASAEQQEAVNLVNVFRFLCGVAPNVVYDASYEKEAQEAAATCRKAGRIAHDLGGGTDKCNLHQGGAGGSMAGSVVSYMQDGGENNRKDRGHRAWILLPSTGRTAFGKDGGFQAMRTLDGSSSFRPKTGTSYPGRGFFPSAYLHGGGWSYYAAPGVSMPAEVKVEIWKLPRSLRSAPPASQLRKGNSVPVLAVFPHESNGVMPTGGSVVFEPDYSEMKQKDGRVVGVYWVRISWRGFKDEYVVDLY